MRAHTSACMAVARLQYDDIVAALLEFVSSAQAGHAGADDDHPAPLMSAGVACGAELAKRRKRQGGGGGARADA